MSEPLRNLSKIIRECLAALKPIQTRAEIDDKLTLSEVIEKLSAALDKISSLQSGGKEIIGEQIKVEKDAKTNEKRDKHEISYEPFRLAWGTTVMVAKEPESSPYAKEWYCKNCFDDKKMAQLQPTVANAEIYQCLRCKAVYRLASNDLEQLREAHGQKPPEPPRQNVTW